MTTQVVHFNKILARPDTNLLSPFFMPLMINCTLARSSNRVKCNVNSTKTLLKYLIFYFGKQRTLLITYNHGFDHASILLLKRFFFFTLRETKKCKFSNTIHCVPHMQQSPLKIVSFDSLRDSYILGRYIFLQFLF